MLGLVTFLLILLGLLVGTWIRPAAGVGAVLCLYGLKQWGQSSTELFSEYREFANIAVFVICVIGVARAAARRGCLVCRMPPAAWLAFAMYAYAFLTILWARDFSTSLDQWIASAPYLVTILVLTPLLINDFDDVRTALIATALAGAALCFLATFFGHWGDRGLVVFGHQGEVDKFNIYRFETNPLALATMAGTVFLICALSLGRPNGILMRLIAIVSIPVALIVVLKSGSRGQFLAGGFSALAVMPIAFRGRRGQSLLTFAVIGAVLLGLAWLAISVVSLKTGRWTETSATEDVAGRLAMAQTLLGESMAHPGTALFGLGNSSSFRILGIYPHITGLEVLAEEGFLGAFLYFANLYLAFRNIKRISSWEISNTRRNALAMLTGLFIFELILSWKQGTLLFSVYVFAYAIMLARIEAMVHEGPSKEPLVLGSNVPVYPNLLR